MAVWLSWKASCHHFNFILVAYSLDYFSYKENPKNYKQIELDYTNIEVN